MSPAADPAQALLRQAMTGNERDPQQGDFLIRCACAQALDALPLYRAACKFYNRRRRFDLAADFAREAVREAARRGDLPVDPMDWTASALRAVDHDLASQALLALKAVAFIALRRGDPDAAAPYLALLRELDPEDGSGASVVSALAASLG